MVDVRSIAEHARCLAERVAQPVELRNRLGPAQLEHRDLITDAVAVAVELRHHFTLIALQALLDLTRSVLRGVDDRLGLNARIGDELGGVGADALAQLARFGLGAREVSATRGPTAACSSKTYSGSASRARSSASRQVSSTRRTRPPVYSRNQRRPIVNSGRMVSRSVMQSPCRLGMSICSDLLTPAVARPRRGRPRNLTNVMRLSRGITKTYGSRRGPSHPRTPARRHAPDN